MLIFLRQFPSAHTSKERNISSVDPPIVSPLLVGDNDSRSHDQIDTEEVSPNNGVDVGPTVRGGTMTQTMRQVNQTMRQVNIQIQIILLSILLHWIWLLTTMWRSWEEVTALGCLQSSWVTM